MTVNTGDRQAVEAEALEAYKQSTGEKAKPSVADEIYNPDGSPKTNEDQVELIGGKFKTNDDLLAAYQALEKKLGESSKPTEPEAPADTPNEEGEAPEGDNTNLDLTKFENELLETGELSEASYEELAKTGIPKSMVDAYIEGQKAQAAQRSTAIFEMVGGQEAYQELTQWAAQNMDESFINEFNTAVNTFDQAKLTRHLEYLQFKAAQAQPTDVKRVEGNSDSVGGIVPFADKTEWQKAASHREYGRDKEYTAMVDKKYLAARRKGLI